MAMTREEKNEYQREWRKRNKEHVKSSYGWGNDETREKRKEYYKEWYKRNKAKVASRLKGYSVKNKEKRSDYAKQYQDKNKERLKESAKKYRDENREKINKNRREYYAINKERLRKKSADYITQNKSKHNAYHSRYARERCKKDPPFKIKTSVSTVVCQALKSRGKTKGGSTFAHLPYTPKELVKHIENQFTDKMNWENHGSYWHIDHHVPHSHFKYESLDSIEFQRCWALANLRPLPAKENLSKGNRFEKDERKQLETIKFLEISQG